ncbi:MAG TPA: phosphatase PAP2 family protein [Cellvibrionaceae bacterium]
MVTTAVLLSTPVADLSLFFWLNAQGARFPLIAQSLSHMADQRWTTPLLIILLATRVRLLAAAMASGLLIHLCVRSIKQHFSVLRPCFNDDLTGVFTAGPSLLSDIFSFPSGHSATASLLAVALVAICGRRALLPAAVLMLAVAASRSMLGAHYPSDTAAGLALGLSISLSSFYLARQLGTGYLSSWRQTVRWYNWEAAAVWLLAACLLLRIGIEPMHRYPHWFKFISLSICVLAAVVLLRQALLHWRVEYRLFCQRLKSQVNFLR